MAVDGSLWDHGEYCRPRSHRQTRAVRTSRVAAVWPLRAWERRGTWAPDETRMGEARAMRPVMTSADRGWLCGDGRQKKYNHQNVQSRFDWHNESHEKMLLVASV